MKSILTFMEWAAINEAARRSFSRTTGKYNLPGAKPMATLTAWRADLLDPSGHPYPEAVEKRLNDRANRKLMANIRRRGLSFYPVIGAGQEERDGEIQMSRENSFVVQPVGPMDDEEFLILIRELLHNPTDEKGRGPFPNTQWGALVKLPSRPDAFLLHHSGSPTSPADYRVGDSLGGSAKPRRGEPFYSQIKYGPRAAPAMTDPLDRPGDLGNIKGQPGRRFVVGGSS